MDKEEKFSLFLVVLFGGLFCLLLLYPDAFNTFIDNALSIPMSERH